MKVLLVNGSPHKNGCTYTALCEVAGALEKNGVETEIFWIGSGEVAGCIGCGICVFAKILSMSLLLRQRGRMDIFLDHQYTMQRLLVRLQPLWTGHSTAVER